ncbi:MAG: signal peptidase I [Bacteroidota bacterium]
MTKDTPKQNPPGKPAVPLKGKAKVIAIAKEVGIILGAFLLLNNFVIASFLVPTGSMENEVMTGDLLFVNKFIYGGTTPRNLQQLDLFSMVTGGAIRLPYVELPWFRLPAIRNVERGDVIVFVFPGYRDQVEQEEFQFYLKRCVGLPGDTIHLIDRELRVNGEPFPLPRNLKFSYRRTLTPDQVSDQIFPRGASWNEAFYGPLVVPFKGMTIALDAAHYRQWEVFVRREGHDIRLENDLVLVDGNPVTEYVVEQDYLFGMGDHRDNSLDSRYWGFIPKDNLIGTPLFVYWSWDSDIPIYKIFARLGSVRFNRIGTLIR